MFRKRILQQKRELDRLSRERIIPREQEPLLEKALQSNLIKVITGPRRSGKTTLAHIVLSPREYAYLNFDDEILARTEDPDRLIGILHEIYGSFETLFIDEIQNLYEWELFANRLQRQGYNLVITGSNSRLLSSELATHLTGRYIEVVVTTFSFREYLLAGGVEYSHGVIDEIKEGRLKRILMDYLGRGGYPEVVVKNYDPISYTRMLFESVVYRDIVKRYRIRYSHLIHELAVYLLANTGREVTYRSLAKTLDVGSVHTAENYLRYLEESYLIQLLPRYTAKTKQRIRAPRKIYTHDNSFLNIEYSPENNLPARLENTVLQELKRRNTLKHTGARIYYWKDEQGREIDFLEKIGTRVTRLIQVTYQLTPDNTKRETTPLIKASEKFKTKNLQIITWDQEETINKKGFKIRVVPLWKWLLNMI